jgi:UDP-3-O-[3-hydroxymyristoyl] glucosamine N-acyltransferase
MSQSSFFSRSASMSLAEFADAFGLKLPEGADSSRRIEGLSALETAGPGDLAYMDNPKYISELSATNAGACLVGPRFAQRVPPGTVAIETPHPYHLFAKALQHFYPGAARPSSMFGAGKGIAPGAIVHPTARLEDGVTVDPGAVIGPDVEIGGGTIICAGAVIGPGVKMGRDGAVGSGATLQCALIGNRVVIHPGVRIGQDGFGFAMSPKGHIKVPQIGRVIIQDDVEIGANTTIDRGASRDTMIGEGTKIDNLVQIGHNVVIGRHCVIIAQVGISGSTVLEDFAVLAGQVGVAGHLTIGAGAQIAAQAGLMRDVPRGEKWGGSPAKPARQWLRETAMLSQMLERPVARPDSAKTDTSE